MIRDTRVPRRVVILGGGTAGWMTASLLAHAWHSRGSTITLVESRDIGTVGVGEGSTPRMRDFFARLGIDERRWMPPCNASYKCGISFPDWSTIAGYESYFHPFFSQLDSEPSDHFYRLVQARLDGFEAPANPTDYFVSGTLAREFRSPKTKGRQEFDHDYAYHFDAALLGRFLREYAIGEGVDHVVDTVSAVDQAEDGDIVALQTAEHGRIEGDLFFDCSGFAAVLIDKTLHEPFVSFKDNLFNDRAVAIPTPIDSSRNLPSETISRALGCGWAWRIPLVSRYGNGYVYSSDFLTPEEAEAELRAHLGKEADRAEARHLRMRTGRVEQHWRRNVVAVGLSQGFIEPLEATALGLVQFTIERFIEAHERGEGTPQLRDEFNRNVNQAFEDTRSYIVMHYKLNTRNDTEYWRANRENDNLPEAVSAMIEAWDRDRASQFDAACERFGGTAYMQPSWYCILAGMGRFGPTDKSPWPGMLAAAKHARGVCRTHAAQFEDHASVLRSYR